MNRFVGLLSLLSASLVFAARATAQGSDNCATATPIAGSGTFNVSTLGATDGFPQPTGCPQIHKDVWFAWTAPQTGGAVVYTCGGATVDTILAAYSGAGCPIAGSQLDCDDDTCNFQSTISFAVTAGNVYMIQVGTWGTTPAFTGTFTIDVPPPPTNDDCSAAIAISGPGPFAFSNLGASTGAQGQSSPTCGSPSTIANDVWFTWTAGTSGTMNVSLCGGGTTYDSKAAVFAGGGCPAGNALACNDNSCGQASLVVFTAVVGTTYTIQIGSSPAAGAGQGAFTIGSGSSGCPNSSVGPDVIVGQISDVLNATAAGGLDALALGTTSCNVGDAVIQWQASNNQHPVIGATLYRHKIVDGAGRFEQIGQSWLKHGFAALTGNVCCTCQVPGSGSLLGVGCSDPYGAGLNGSQSNLGPRWQVNAHTGVFTYPPANPAWSGATPRRCEVALSDLEPSSASVHYYGETTYVTADDAAAGNNNNNSSYTAMTVTGSATDFTFALSGSTNRMLQALRAWPIVEPGVTLTNVQIPSEGLFLVGSKATSLGGGQFHYEFAVHNMNSDRNGGSFSVAIPAGASVSNIGFHDIAYRNGDGPGNVNFDGTDWTSNLAGGVLTWSTQTFAQNPSANALRWSATYNFRFDSDAPPTTGNVTLGLWKSGAPGSVLAAAQVPNGAPGVPFCFGDGTGTPCPCGNNSAVGANAGCLNSLGQAGALVTNGTASVAGDTFVLAGSGMSATGTCLYFQGTTQSAGGAGALFGDGLRCASGTVVRLGTETNASGASQYPSAGDPPISLQGAISAGDVRTYQCWYRNIAAFCTPDGFNLTNGVQATWQP